MANNHGQEHTPNSILVESPPPAGKRRKGSLAQLSSSLIKYRELDSAGANESATAQVLQAGHDLVNESARRSGYEDHDVFTEEFAIPFGASQQPRSQLEQNYPVIGAKTDNRTQQYSKKAVEPMTVKPKQFAKKSHLMGFTHQEPPLNMTKASTEICGNY